MRFQIHRKDILPSNKPNLQLGYYYNQYLATNRFHLNKSYNSLRLEEHIRMMQNYSQLKSNRFHYSHLNKYNKDCNLNNIDLGMFRMMENNNSLRMQWYNLGLYRKFRSYRLHIDNKEYSLNSIDLSKFHRLDSRLQ
jgi:hypothetical protein